MIEIQNLVKRYGDITAVNDVSFSVKRGEILGFLGPNGAGKTTTMNILTGYISATSGVVTVDGHDILEEPLEVKRRIGYLPENPPLYRDMTVLEYLNFVADLKGIARRARAAEIGSALRLVRITDVAHRLVGNLSKGDRQRVGIAQALIGHPDVLVLDEPTVGLDPKQIIEIRNTIRELGRDHTIILSSHILPEVSAVCDRVVIINRGEIVALDDIDALNDRSRNSRRMEITVEAGARVAQRLRRIPASSPATSAQRDGVATLLYETEPDRDVRRQVFYEMARQTWPILDTHGLEATLEDVFLEVTGNVQSQQLGARQTRETRENRRREARQGGTEA